MTENTNTTASHDSNPDPLRGIVDSLTNLGVVWAQHGVSMGRLALKTQSAWLLGLSTLLNQVADAMEPLSRSAHATNDASSTPDAPISH